MLTYADVAGVAGAGVAGMVPPIAGAGVAGMVTYADVAGVAGAGVAGMVPPAGLGFTFQVRLEPLV